MQIQMKCAYVQPTAAQDGASLGGARVVLVENAAPGKQTKGARLEVFLEGEFAQGIKMGDIKTVTIT